MKRIVADAGPLIMFARGGLLSVLRETACEIIVPAAVMAECTRETAKPGASALLTAASSAMFTVEPEPDQTDALSGISGLGGGEMAVVALARRFGCPALIDDALARRAVAQLAVPVIGAAGILLAAKSQGRIARIAPILEQWRSWGYFLAPGLVAAVLSRADESP